MNAIWPAMKTLLTNCRKDASDLENMEHDRIGHSHLSVHLVPVADFESTLYVLFCRATLFAVCIRRFIVRIFHETRMPKFAYLLFTIYSGRQNYFVPQEDVARS